MLAQPARTGIVLAGWQEPARTGIVWAGWGFPNCRNCQLMRRFPKLQPSTQQLNPSNEREPSGADNTSGTGTVGDNTSGTGTVRFQGKTLRRTTSVRTTRTGNVCFSKGSNRDRHGFTEAPARRENATGTGTEPGSLGIGRWAARGSWDRHVRLGFWDRHMRSRHVRILEFLNCRDRQDDLLGQGHGDRHGQAWTGMDRNCWDRHGSLGKGLLLGRASC